MNAFELMNSLGLEGRVEAAIPMRELTTMRVGGAADCVVHAAGEQDIVNVMRACRENAVPLTLVGRGSNLVVRDGGLRGVVLHLGAEFSRVTEEGDRVTAQAGATLGALARKAQQLGLAGLEFAEGIPGSVGGGVYMNAGAYGGEMSQVLESARVLTPSGDIVEMDAAALDMRYRHTSLMETGGVVLSATFLLRPDDPSQIAARMADYSHRRREKQPLQYASSGSFFKRPEGYFAGKLIMDSGLAGYQVGGAQVSEKHCGFVINAGGATARDVRTLMDNVRDIVYKKYGVTLEPEVKFLGDFEA